MEDSMNKIVAVTAVSVLLIATANATVWKVPEDRATIQAAIHDLASNGDVISVWGPPPGQPSYPPYHYYENVNYEGKNLTVASRCFLPGWTGCTPTYDSVVIDGQQLGPVVTMTGSEDAVLKGFTIQHGHTSGYGGGVNCNAGSVLKNHILDDYSATGGGGVYYLTQARA
jgi:hypothetical protein